MNMDIANVPTLQNLDGYVLLKKELWEEIKEEIEANNPRFLRSLEANFAGSSKNWRTIKEQVNR